MALRDPRREDVRPTVWLAALAIVLACVVFAISFARWIERGGIEETARALADRASTTGTIDRPPRADAALDGGVAFAWAPEIRPIDPARATTDPQLEASHRSFGTEDASMPPPFRETWARGHLVSVSGETDFQRGDECWVRVLPVQSYGFNCLVRVTCGDVVVYPDAVEQAGYAPCDVDEGRVLTGRDESPSGRDGDPTLHLDLRRGRVEVTDAAPRTDDPYSSFETPPRDFSLSIVLDAPRA